jgi:hypothetical protein
VTAATWRAARATAAAFALAAGALVAPRGAHAQAPAPALVPSASVEATAPAAAPFRVREVQRYDAFFGPVRVGRGSMAIVGVDTVRGRAAYHAVFRLRGGTPFYRMDDTFESWFDVRTLASRRFVKHQREGRRVREARFEIYPERRAYAEARGGASNASPDAPRPEQPSVEAPLDDASFLYFVRTVAHDVGRENTIALNYKPDRNPGGERVLRRERVTVPAGAFDAVVLQPAINTTGLLARSRRTEVWLSDDARRLVLRVQSHLPFGTITLQLTGVEAGDAGGHTEGRAATTAAAGPGAGA